MKLTFKIQIENYENFNRKIDKSNNTVEVEAQTADIFYEILSNSLLPFFLLSFNDILMK